MAGFMTNGMLLGVSVAVMSAAPVPAFAQAQTYRFDLPAQSLDASLRAFARTTRQQILFDGTLVRGKKAPALKGSYSAEQGLSVLLGGSGLTATRARGGAWVVSAVGNGGSTEEASRSGEVRALEPDAEIVVTGSRVRGAVSASPAITLTPEGIRESGRATLADALRDIPQNFGGGQNPGIGFNVPESVGADVGGGSSINLRGLGSDATLTLLNGRRIAYNGAVQAIDVSIIPLGAVDRVDIVPDGSSALYGSDAVGGVVNIVLKRDFDGLETRARLGGSTDGGNFQQQYAVTGGARWGTGGVIAAFEYNRTGKVDYLDRDYTRERARGLDLFPDLDNRNMLLSAHQKIGDVVTFSVDALYNDRRTNFVYATNAAGDRDLSSQIRDSKDRSFAIAPSLLANIGRWQASVSGSYASDRIDYAIDGTAGSVRSPLARIEYDNVTKSAELSANGPLFSMPGGPAKLAVGAGYSQVSLDSFRGAGAAANFDHQRDSHFVYAEIVAPLISPVTGIDGVRRLQFSAAFRHESYDDAGSVTTPRLGLIYAPVDDLDFKASWGRSFRAPTMYQRYSPFYVSTYPATTLGGSGYPADAIILYSQGRNEGLRPERASTLALTADFHPSSLPGLLVSATYFRVNYVDRIVTPITALGSSLSNPANAPFVTLAPSSDLVASIVSAADLFSNDAGGVFDPAKVVAYVDNSNVNAGRQTARGFDIQTSYEFAVGADQRISFGGNVSYLESERQLTVGQPEVQLAGMLFNPPHWRGRATLGWRNASLTVIAAANYTGKIEDARKSAVVSLDPQTTFDLSARYSSPESAGGLAGGLTVGVSAQNIFNASPPLIATSSVYLAPYDTTNYRPFGRVIAVELSKKW